MRFTFLEAVASAAPQSGAEGSSYAVPEDARAAVEAMRCALGLARFESVRVAHCAHAYGLALEGGPEGEARWKLVFSADTRPCQALVEAARGATVLIHEVRAALRCAGCWVLGCAGCRAAGLAALVAMAQPMVSTTRECRRQLAEVQEGSVLCGVPT